MNAPCLAFRLALSSTSTLLLFLFLVTVCPGWSQELTAKDKVQRILDKKMPRLSTDAQRTATNTFSFKGVLRLPELGSAPTVVQVNVRGSSVQMLLSTEDGLPYLCFRDSIAITFDGTKFGRVLVCQSNSVEFVLAHEGKLDQNEGKVKFTFALRATPNESFIDLNVAGLIYAVSKKKGLLTYGPLAPTLDIQADDGVRLFIVFAFSTPKLEPFCVETVRLEKGMGSFSFSEFRLGGTGALLPELKNDDLTKQGLDIKVITNEKIDGNSALIPQGFPRSVAEAEAAQKLRFLLDRAEPKK